ncbi:fungal-specific transcription factor domain-containing protein [Leptodontidium sp. MPI-SDFR-AT-0119]|nr:fungal-specific transcription factor domain-containing protein [Leptodontidium sp. MPI-SDFR-AT-0119]
MPQTGDRRSRLSDDDSPAPAPKRTATRKRAPLACEECRVRKRKCDSATPSCGACTKRRTICVYLPEIQAREWHQSMIQSLKSRLRELEDTDVWPKSDGRSVSVVSPTITTTTTTKATTAGLPSAQPQPQPQPTNTTALMRSPKRGDNATTTALPSASQTQSPDNSTATTLSNQTPPTPRDQMREIISLDPIQFPQTGPIQEVSPSRCIEPDSLERLMKPIGVAFNNNNNNNNGDFEIKTHTPSTESTGLPAPSSLAPSQKMNCTCTSAVDAMRCSLPPRKRADALINVFFSRIHRMYPALHEPTFRKQYERLFESKSTAGQSMAATSCCGFCTEKSGGALCPATVHAVLALGALFETSSLEQNAIRADAFFQFVQGFDLLETLDNEVGIELVQLGLLMGFYLQSTSRYSKCWNISGLTIRMAQNMGLHFNIVEARKRGLISSCPTQLDCEMRTRVWHTCILLETEVSMSFGQPMMVPSAGKHVMLPEVIDDERLSTEVGKWNAQPEGIPSLMESFVHRMKLYDIIGQVLDRQQLDTGTLMDATASIQSIINLDNQITEWRNKLPSYLRYDPQTSACNSIHETTADAVTNPNPSLDMRAMSKRLYCKFLHTRQLILRPALDLMFASQQTRKKAGSNPESMEAGVSDSVLSSFASQTVLNACSFVTFLALGIGSHNFTCWWDNIGYLHTCGSTILIARLCQFDDPRITDDSLSTSWGLCVQYLSRYTGVSIIAKRSSQLLRESAKRLLGSPYPQPGTKCLQSASNQNILTTNKQQQQQQQALLGSPLDFSNDTVQPVVDLNRSQVLDKDISLQQPRFEWGRDCLSETVLGEGFSDFNGGDLWDFDPTGAVSWPFMPSLSQLETFPQRYNGSNMAR